MRWRNPTIKYITIADLPHVLDWQTILNINIDQKYINVTIQGERGTPMLYLAEGNDIRRVRNRTNVTAVLGPNVWVQSYDIRDIADTHPDLGNIGSHADITRITHFIFRGLVNSEERLLAVENPLYRGGGR